LNGEPPFTALKHYGSAFAVSVLCHAVVVLGILPRLFVGDRVAPPPITLTIRDAGAAGGDGDSADPSGGANTFSA
jgi:hypothetical protein